MNPIDLTTTSSQEDYLEAIVMLKESDGEASVTGLSKALSVKKPSVDWALRKLQEAGLVVHERYGKVDLTPEGAKIAGEVYHRHVMLTSFLQDILKVDPDVAEEDACRMEHAMSRQSIRKLEAYMDAINQGKG